MADFPMARYHKPVISSMSSEGIGLPVASVGGISGVSGLWPTANLAVYVPFAISANYLVKLLWWVNGSAVAGTVDVAILTVGGTRLIDSTSTGAGGTATTQAGVSVIQSVTLATPYLLVPGSYYMGMSVSTGATASYFKGTGSVISDQFYGIAQQTTAHPIPATATFATIANGIQPFFGIASSGVI